jgi:hypothetical protein
MDRRHGQNHGHGHGNGKLDGRGMPQNGTENGTENGTGMGMVNNIVSGNGSITSTNNITSPAAVLALTEANGSTNANVVSMEIIDGNLNQSNSIPNNQSEPQSLSINHNSNTTPQLVDGNHNSNTFSQLADGNQHNIPNNDDDDDEEEEEEEEEEDHLPSENGLEASQAFLEESTTEFRSDGWEGLYNPNDPNDPYVKHGLNGPEPDIAHILGHGYGDNTRPTNLSHAKEIFKAITNFVKANQNAPPNSVSPVSPAAPSNPVEEQPLMNAINFELLSPPPAMMINGKAVKWTFPPNGIEAVQNPNRYEQDLIIAGENFGSYKPGVLKQTQCAPELLGLPIEIKQQTGLKKLNFYPAIKGKFFCSSPERGKTVEEILCPPLEGGKVK